jgi:Tol biopolymer transport system component/DNA-binding winged helix-turn-helix (wHTH) protein
MDQSGVGGPTRVKFGDVELDLQTYRLTRRGRALRLERIPRDILLLLIERRGDIVTRQQLVERIWGPGVFLDTDNAINGAIRKIRQTLKDRVDQPRYIETVTGQGYRFIAAVTGFAAATDPAIQPAPAVEAGSLPTLDRQAEPLDSEARVRAPSGGWRPMLQLAFLALIALGAVSVSGAFFSAPAPPVVRFRQPAVSDRAEPWHSLVTDGTRVYFMERSGSQWNPVQTSLTAGSPSPVRAPFPNTRILDVSRDRSEFLIGTFAAPGGSLPLWIWPVQGGSPVRVDGITAEEAIWTPDGRRVVYTRASEIRIARRDGREDRLLIATPGKPHMLRWSPDARRLSYTVADLRTSARSLWEAHANGREARVRVPSTDPRGVCCGSWTPDGRHFIYSASTDGIFNLWAIREQPRLLGWKKWRPVQLTSSPTSTYASLPTADGRLFTFLDGSRFEYVKYSPATEQVVPVFSDLHALDLQLSPDGTQVAFQRFPDFSLWRSNIDGTERLRLVDAPMRVSQPRWSPDGRRVAFEGLRPGGQRRAYVVGADGGPVEEILPNHAGLQSLPTWSPDGRSVVVALNVHAPEDAGVPRGLYIVDASTRSATKVPASEGMTTASWSPDGRQLVAKDRVEQHLMRFEPATKSWTAIATGRRLSGASWSGDSKFVYYQDSLEFGSPVHRVNVASATREKVFSFEPLLKRGIHACAFQGISNDGNALVQLTRAGTHIYALDLELR